MAKNPISMIKTEFKKNNLYKPRLINWYNWKDHPLNVVSDPQKPNPKINLYLLLIGRPFINPNMKQPIIFTIKILSICHRNNAPGTAPIEIRKNWYCLKKILIYQ